VNRDFFSLIFINLIEGRIDIDDIVEKLVNKKLGIAEKVVKEIVYPLESVIKL